MTPSREQQALDEAIEHLYCVFDRYRTRSSMPHCEHCVWDEDIRLLTTPPLREVAKEALSKFASKAMTTWGEVGDFKHYLPRICELLLAGGEDMYGEEITLGKLTYGNWRTWPAVEQEAVEQFLQAWWSRELTVYPAPTWIESCLCGTAQAVDDLTPFLQEWQRRDCPAAARHLAELLDYLSCFRGHLPDGFWDWREEQGRQVEAWLLSPQTRESLERAFFRYADADFAGDLSVAVQQHEWLTNAAAE